MFLGPLLLVFSKYIPSWKSIVKLNQLVMSMALIMVENRATSFKDLFEIKARNNNNMAYDFKTSMKKNILKSFFQHLETIALKYQRFPHGLIRRSPKQCRPLVVKRSPVDRIRAPYFIYKKQPHLIWPFYNLS